MNIPESHIIATARLLTVMGMTPFEHQWRIFSEGVRYFEALEPASPFREEILYNRKLWLWWAIQWHKRNRAVVHEFDLFDRIEATCDRKAIKAAFDEIHNVTGRIYPNRTILEASLAPVMGEFIKTKVKK